MRMTLRSLFNRYNRKYFSGKLQVSDVRFGRVQGSTHADTTFLESAAPIVTLGKHLKDTTRFLHMVLLHEMTHVDLGPAAGHGPKFVKRMRKLVRQGAFDDLL